MKYEKTKTDRWIELMRKYHGKPLTVEQTIDELDQMDFWTEKDLSRGIRNWKAEDVRRWMREGPKVDTDGEVIERVNVKTVSKETGRTEQVYLALPYVETYEDKVQVVETAIKQREYFDKEALRLYNFYLPTLTPKERKRYVQHFQGLLAFGEDQERTA